MSSLAPVRKQNEQAFNQQVKNVSDILGKLLQNPDEMINLNYSQDPMTGLSSSDKETDNS